MKTSIVFFGTPEFAVPALSALIDAPFCDVQLAVTQPDKPIGRHHSKPVPSPVKQLALEAGIDVIDSPSLTRRGLGGGCSELGVLVAYGEIIPKDLIDAFPLGILNIHPSLLPKYRGSSPIQAAILNQDKETGVTIMRLDDAMDHGPVVIQERVKLHKTETAGDLHDTLAKIGAKLLIKTLPDYIAGRIALQTQNDEQASYTRKLTKQDGRIDWSKPASAISAQVRAMNPWPGAWTEWENKKLIIWSMRKDGTPAEVQLEAKKRMAFSEFMRGHPDFKIPAAAGRPESAY
ncbi:MAG: methionyl-tRNA formyltransferase [Parcubacteria group bacterium]|nr:methionyl-tRNA formyltransferase [Parcubacteria group bacterium]